MTHQHHHPVYCRSSFNHYATQRRGANCFIFNDVTLFRSYQTMDISVKQLDGSGVTAESYGVVFICPLMTLNR
jgi:hypothetical protein